MNRSSLSRLHELDRMIRLGTLESADQAARSFETSRRTIERDLDQLRRLGAHLTYNRTRGCYEYAGKPLTLTAQWLNERELAVILIAERALRVFTDAWSSEQIHPVFNKLLDPIRHDRDTIAYIAELCSCVHFHRPVEPGRSLRQEFSVVLDAIMARKRVSTHYAPPGTRDRDRREIEPYALVNNGGDWYVIGFCRRHHDIRTFVLAHMSEPAAVEHFFSIPAGFKVEEYLSQGFGRMRGVTARRVSLRIREPASGWVGRSRWHPTQKTSRTADGALRLRMSCPVTESLVRWVLQMGECVTVEAPEELRVAVVAKAEATVRNNRRGT